MPDLPPTTGHRTASGSIAPGYFDALYERDPDPWDFDTSDYEAAKYTATLDALPRLRYRRGLEIGCANGALTHELATWCDTLLAVDVAAAAVERARARCADRPAVEVRQMGVPDEWPAGQFDLIVISEVGYYLSRPDLARLMERCAGSTALGAHLVLVHWTERTDYPLSGNAVHEAFLDVPHWRRVSGRRAPRYRLDVLARR